MASLFGLKTRALTGKPAKAPNANARLLFLCCARLAIGTMVLALCGCATELDPTPAHRAFKFDEDTLAYPNELVWEYRFDAKGKWVSSRRVPPPSYSHHCFVVARSVRQFFFNARFVPELPVANEATYRELVRRVVSTNPRHSFSHAEKVVIPGYHDLRSFSAAHETLLKQECGGAWESYFQRGHWRMICPLSRNHQEAMAQQIVAHLAEDGAVVIHVVRFPSLLINHALVIFGQHQEAGHIRFDVYDPNDPRLPVKIDFDRSKRTFYLPANSYFPGGRVDVYEVYHRWNY